MARFVLIDPENNNNNNNYSNFISPNPLHNNLQSNENDINFINDNYNQGVPCAITIFHPQCGHCHNMRPSWENAGNNLQRNFNKKVIIAFVHKDFSNRMPIQQERIQGFPHIVFASKKGETEYSGERNESNFKNWIAENTNKLSNQINENLNLIKKLKKTNKKTNKKRRKTRGKNKSKSLSKRKHLTRKKNRKPKLKVRFRKKN